METKDSIAKIVAEMRTMPSVYVAIHAWADRLEAMGWRPIESAPRDGTAVIIASYSKPREEWTVCEAQWLIPYEGCDVRQGSWGLIGHAHRCILDESIHNIGASKWMPLPEPPETKESP